MGCAGSVPPPSALQPLPQSSQTAGAAGVPTEIVRRKPDPNDGASAEHKYKAFAASEAGSVLVDDDGCGTVIAPSNENEETSSAHRYVDFVARERRSIAETVAEPSAFANAIAHKYRVARAYVKYGITGDVDQYQEEVDKAVPTFSSRARSRIHDWLKGVIQAPVRGTKVDKVKLFQRVERGSVVGLNGANHPDVRKSVTSSSKSTSKVIEAKTLREAHVTVEPEDVIDELLMGSIGTPVKSPKDGSYIGVTHAQGGGEAVISANAVPFAIPDNYGLIAESYAVGTVIGVEGDNNQFDLVVVEEEVEVLDDEYDKEHLQITLPAGGLGASANTDMYLTPRASQKPFTSSSSRLASSADSRDRFDCMSVSHHSSDGFEGGRQRRRDKEDEEEAGGPTIENDPICQSIHMHNSINLRDPPPMIVTTQA